MKTLLPVVYRLHKRFDIQEVCVVADRGMISEKTIDELTQRDIRYILGARLRNVKEIRETNGTVETQVVLCTSFA